MFIQLYRLCQGCAVGVRAFEQHSGDAQGMRGEPGRHHRLHEFLHQVGNDGQVCTVNYRGTRRVL